MNENITSTMKKSRTAKKHNHAFSNNHFEMKKNKEESGEFWKKRRLCTKNRQQKTEK